MRSTELSDLPLLAELTMTRRLARQWLVISVTGFLLASLLFSAIFAAITGRAEFRFGVDAAAGFDIVDMALAFVAFVFLTLAPIPIHEWLHGVAMTRYGGKPRYGVGLSNYVLPYAYATTDSTFTRNQFVVIALTPLVVISLVGIAAMAVVPTPWLIVPLAVNAGGAVGDCWMAAMLLGYPSTVRVEDCTTGLRIYGATRAGDTVDTERDSVSTPATFVRTAVVNFALTFGVLVVAAFAAPLLLAAVGVESLVLGFAEGPWYLLRYGMAPTGEFSATFGLFGILTLSVVLGVLAALGRIVVDGRRSARPPRAT